MYAVNGDRTICTQEDSLIIVVSKTLTATLELVLIAMKNVICFITLPTTTYNDGYYSQSGGNAADDIIANLMCLTISGTLCVYFASMIEQIAT